MKQPKYQLKSQKDLHVFYFTSTGPKGDVPKMIIYTETNLNGFYNLAFGDLDKTKEKIND